MLLTQLGGRNGQFYDNNGRPLRFGKVWIYASSTNRLADSYPDGSGGSRNTSPVLLDHLGQAEIFVEAGTRVELFDQCGAAVDGMNGRGRI